MKTVHIIGVWIILVSILGGQAGAGEKSLSKAMLYSLLLPGAGEAYMGYHTRAKAAMASEIGIWAGFAYFRYQGSLREDRYKEMAEIHAGASGEKDDDYYQAIAYYLSNDVFNVDVLREARFYYPDDRDLQLEYWEANGYFGADGWEWDTILNMDEYRDVRTESRRSYRRATLMVGFAVLNRMISLVELYVSSKTAHGRAAALPQVGFDERNGGSAYLYLNLPMIR
jgi:hypothetical protein